MTTNYALLIQKHPDLADKTLLRDVYIGGYSRVTLFRQYRAVDLFLSGQDGVGSQPDNARLTVDIINPGIYNVIPGIYNGIPAGNLGFLPFYIKVYDSIRLHPVYGEYVAWRVLVQ